MTEKATLQAVLNCKMLPNDADASTVEEYLRELAAVLWREGEGLSGKRPFGNSGWESEILRSLAAERLVPADATTYDDTDYVDYDLHDDFSAEQLVAEALQAARLVIL